MIITEKAECCGCAACANVCPKNCIEMKPDKEGFLYPTVNEDSCINCGLCKKTCPILNNFQESTSRQKAYLVQHKNEQIRAESTSGGAFTAISKLIIDKKGVVFGAAYNKKLQVVHTYVESIDDLKIFRNSKYVQSVIGDSFQKVKKFLIDGRIVCFSGTPCQIEGLKLFLNKEYENLIMVDIVCHAVPSPLAWNKYLDYQNSCLNSNISNIKFRDKYPYGYNYGMMSIYEFGKEKPTYFKGVETDFMLRAFFSNICDRPSCYKCKFKKQFRVSDITIWDCFETYKFDTKFDDKGTSRVLIQTEKGQLIFNKIKSSMRVKEVLPEELVKNVKEMFNSVPMNRKRSEFFADLNHLSYEEILCKYFPENLHVKLERCVRIALNKIGIYYYAKRLAKKVLRR